MKIGITFEPTETANDIFGNGIKQNALFFYELLDNMGYDVSFIIPQGTEDKLLQIYGVKKNSKFLFYQDILNLDLDILFQFTFQVDSSVLISLKENGVKIILYKCGNDFVMDLEDSLHLINKQKIPQCSSLSDNLPIFDQIWSIPQHENTNYYYWKTLWRTDVKIVKPIWSNTIMQEFEKIAISGGFGDFKYKNRGSEKKIAIFEPNLNVVKWFFPALLVCENAYRKIKDKIKFIYVTNILTKNDNLNMDVINTIVKPLDLNKDKKISIESRYNSLYFMSAHSDVCVSHQWENPLNYLYLDLAWYGWPVVHNAQLCKDIGYYYDGFNYEQGGKVLEKVIKTHDKKVDEYIERNRKLIDRYLPTNKQLQESYRKLIEELFK